MPIFLRLFDQAVDLDVHGRVLQRLRVVVDILGAPNS